MPELPSLTDEEARAISAKVISFHSNPELRDIDYIRAGFAAGVAAERERIPALLAVVGVAQLMVFGDRRKGESSQQEDERLTNAMVAALANFERSGDGK